MSYDDGKQLSNLQRIHELEEMVSGLEEQNVKLSDLLRWRRWPDEKPEYQGQYQAFWDRSEGVFVVNYDPFTKVQWKHCVSSPAYWRPIGPLPGGE